MLAAFPALAALLAPTLAGAQAQEEPPLLAPGDVVSGVVDDDCPRVTTPTLSGPYSLAPVVGRPFRVRVKQSGVHHLDLRAPLFDAYLVLRDETGAPLAEDDDGLLRGHSRIVCTLEAGRTYRVEACALHGGRGPFELALRAGAPPLLSVADRARAELEDARNAVEVAREFAGEESAATVQALDALSGVHLARGEVVTAVELSDRALALGERVLDPDDPALALVLLSRGYLHHHHGEPPRAREPYERALAILTEAYGPDHGLTDRARGNLAFLLRDLGELEAARALFEERLALRERVLGPESELTLPSLRDLASVLSGLGDWPAAESLLRRALAGYERLGDPLELAHTQNDLGALLRIEGDYRQARALIEAALEGFERHAAPAEFTARARANLGMVLHSLGDLAGAREALERGVEELRRAPGVEPPALVGALTSLADVLVDLEVRGPAADRYGEALALSERFHGPDHPNTAIVLTNLGRLELQLGRPAEAAEHLDRARAVFEASLGPAHPWTARAVHNLAQACWDLGETQRAGELLERAARDHALALGPAHPFTIAMQGERAFRLGQAGRVAEGAALAAEAGALARRHLLAVLPALDEGEAYRALAQLRWLLDLELDLTLGLDEPDAARRAYAAALAWKGQVGRFLTLDRARLRASLGPEDRARLDALREGLAELSRQAFTPGAADAEALHELRERCDALERAWRAGAGVLATTLPSVDAIAAALPPGAALVDLLVRAGGRREDVRSPGEPLVSAWVLRAGGGPVHVDLGPAAPLEEGVRALLRRLGAPRGVPVTAGRGEAATDPDADLRARLWDPLAPLLEDVDTVFVSPDGFLGALPFGVLGDGQGGFLLERRAFAVVADASALPALAAGPAPAYGSLLAVGGVDFGRRADAGQAVADARGGLRHFWPRLPATTAEAQVVHDLHEAAFPDAERALVQGEDATEERLKAALAGPAVLHLATHGFFEAEDPRAPARMASGLVCAGANVPDPGREDGYLTAGEVAWLDLSHAELVVLSACETALGRPEAGEGLIGLVRAFHTAGARTVVSSVWNVRDAATAELMQRYYEDLWLRGLGRLAALREAQLWLLERNRREQRDPLPGTWGAFVSSGDWR